MTHRILTAMNQQANLVMTYLLRLVNGQEHLIVAISPNEVMSMPDNGNTWTARIFEGGTIEVPDHMLMAVEPNKYQVDRFNGQTSKTEIVTEKKLEQILDKATNPKTGEVQGNIRAVGEVGNDENRVTRRRDERFL